MLAAERGAQPAKASEAERHAVYLRAAAVNFAATVDDTNDLSTVRGSSLTLLRAPQRLVEHLRTELSSRAAVTLVYEGASEVVVRLTPLVPPAPGPVPSELEAAKASARSKKQKKDADDKIRAWQQAHAAAALAPLAADAEAISRAFLAKRQGALPFDLFSFTVVTEIAHPARKAPLKILESKTAIAQFTQATVPIPPEPPAGLRDSIETVCALNRVLPAEKDTAKGWLSASVQARRTSGRQQKQHFYEAELARLLALARPADPSADPPADPPADAETISLLTEAKDALNRAELGFASSFEDIVDDPPKGLPPNVAGKIAVVHLDGNGFGALRGEVHKRGGDEVVGRLSADLQRKRGRLLARLLLWMLSPQMPTMRIVKKASDEPDEPNERVRFETLLWGGDEMCFVLPAWHGWQFIGEIVDEIGTWRVIDEPNRPLTYAIGMVFASAKTPIRDLRRAAADLSEAAKDRGADGKAANRQTVQVLPLEGIDFAELDVRALRKRFYPAAAAEAFSLPGDRWQKLTEAIVASRARIGLSQLHRQYRAALDRKFLKPSDPEKPIDPNAISAFVSTMLGRLRERGADDPDIGLLTGDLLRRGTADHPLIPLFQYIQLQDYVEPLRSGDNR